MSHDVVMGIVKKECIINDSCLEDGLTNSVQTAWSESVEDSDSFEEKKYCPELCSNHLEGHFHECCVLNATKIKRENSDTEDVEHKRLGSTKNRYFAETNVVRDLAEAADNGEDLTVPNNSGKHNFNENDGRSGIGNRSERPNYGKPSKESRNTLCNYHSSVKNKGVFTKQHTDERPRISRSTFHDSSDDNEKKRVLHYRENAAIKTTSIDTDGKKQNIVVQNLDNKIWDPSCSFCSHELEARKISPRKHLRDGTMKEKLQTVTNTDFKRPMSAASTSDKYTVGSEPKQRSKKEYVAETDPTIISRRQKQIDYGKNTTGYQRYKEMVPKDQRRREDPHTPPKCEKFSRRGWDGLIRSWRRKLHDWDPPRDDSSDDEHGSLMSLSSIPSSLDGSENMDVITEPATKKFLLTKDKKTDVTVESGPNEPE